MSSSLISGIAKLSVTFQEYHDEEGDPWPEFQHLGDEGMMGYPHNDSVEVFLSEQCNESQIVTIEDLSQNTVNESILGLTNLEEIRAELPKGFLDEDLFEDLETLDHFK